MIMRATPPFFLALNIPGVSEGLAPRSEVNDRDPAQLFRQTTKGAL
jgi:hypothetical protein